MDEIKIKQIIKKQRDFFAEGATLNVDYRIHMLTNLYQCIKRYENEIHAAIKKDLGKSSFESYMCETGLVLSEISYMMKHVKKFAKEKKVPTPLVQFHSRSYVKQVPYGVCLIMSPWNYPFLLTIEPLVDAIAAGNTAVVKPSAYSAETTKIIGKIISECFKEEYVAFVDGGREENQYLLAQKFDFIFFTGSKTVGKEVMRSAANHLTKVTLELGGKSPCIVDETANLKLAAKRIVFGKFLNCGQTCVAPDYVYCDSRIKDELVSHIRKQIRVQYGKKPLANRNYGKIINQKHFDRIHNLIVQSKVIVGGAVCKDTCQIEPTVMDRVTFEDAVMQEEIFGPVLPILTYQSLEEAVTKIEQQEHPLALYLFTDSKENEAYVTSRVRYGGGCINDTVVHLATSEMGFGGFMESGMGAYHGKAGFDNFTHQKSILDKKTWIDLPMRYQPYRRLYGKLIRLFLK